MKIWKTQNNFEALLHVPHNMPDRQDMRILIKDVIASSNTNIINTTRRSPSLLLLLAWIPNIILDYSRTG